MTTPEILTTTAAGLGSVLGGYLGSRTDVKRLTAALAVSNERFTTWCRTLAARIRTLEVTRGK